jgi:pheromone shutdown-related protein TraB
MHFKNIFIIGTSHIARSSINELKEAYDSLKPDIVAIELDSGRLAALQEKKKSRLSLSSARQIGIKGYLFAVIGSFLQKKLGSIVGVDPGSEMLSAVHLASKDGKRIELIDRDIRITLFRFSKKLSFLEIMKILFDLLFAPLTVRKKIRVDLSTVPEKETIRLLIGYIKQRYPNIYQVLIAERNSFMAKKLFKLMRENPSSKIFAVVGAGHEEGMIEVLKRLEQANLFA